MARPLIDRNRVLGSAFARPTRRGCPAIELWAGAEKLPLEKIGQGEGEAARARLTCRIAAVIVLVIAWSAFRTIAQVSFLWVGRFRIANPPTDEHRAPSIGR